MPLVSPAASIAAVRARIHDSSATNPLQDEEAVDACIQEAVRQDYSRHRPDVVTVDRAGAGALYLVDSLPDYDLGFSQVTGIEYPAAEQGDTFTPPVLLGDQEWGWYRQADGLYLVLYNRTPVATETVRITYTVPRVHTTSQDTVYPADRDAVLTMAASLMCHRMATQAANSEDSVALVAQGVSRGSAADRWLRLAEALKARYLAHMGLDQTTPQQAASGTRAWQGAALGDPRGRRAWLTH